MADYIQPDYVEKRLRYFDGQLLKDQDFVDEQKYFIDRQRRYNRFLNVSGIIHGLTLTPATDFVTVAPGAALDNSGRLVVLSDQVIDKDRQVQLGAYRDTTVDLVIAYKEDPDPPIGEAPRFREKPQLTVVSSGSRPDGAIALARLTIDKNGGVTVDTKVRVYAGVRFPYDGGGPELRAGSVGRLDVTGDLSVSGKVGIGATMEPAEMLQVKGGKIQLDGDQQLKFTDTDLSGKLLKVQLWSGYGLGLNADTLFYASGKHSWRDVNGATERMALTTGADGGLTVLGTGTSSFAGNVSIGTSDPGAFRLKVEGGDTSLGGALTIGRKDTIAPHMINLFQGAASPDSGFLTFGDGTGWKFHVGKSSDKGATKFLTIQDNGNVGIGTPDPKAKLHIDNPNATDSEALRLSNSNTGFAAGEGVYLSYWVGGASGNEMARIQAANKTATILSHGYLAFYTRNSDALTEKVRIDNAGNVGIGTPTPEAKLEVAGIGNSAGQISLQLRSGNSADNFESNQITFGYNNTAQYRHVIKTRHHSGQQANNAIDFYVWKYDGDKADPAAIGGLLTMTLNGGNVGIGTTSPTAAKLVVNGGIDKNGLTGAYINAAEAHNAVTHGVHPISIQTSGTIWAGHTVIATSDERIKNIQGRSDSATDLHTLLDIEITDFCYKDVIGKGKASHKKVIAQQVEKVFPQAVGQHTDVVPDIYQKATIEDGWVKLATNLQKGERVRLIGEKKEGIHDVLEVEQDRFRTDFPADGDVVFVYGREVNDFRSVDYDAIAMLNVSATQELAKRVDSQQSRIAKLEDENAFLKAKLTDTYSVLSPKGW